MLLEGLLVRRQRSTKYRVLANYFKDSERDTLIVMQIARGAVAFAMPERFL